MKKFIIILLTILVGVAIIVATSDKKGETTEIINKEISQDVDEISYDIKFRSWDDEFDLRKK